MSGSTTETSTEGLPEMPVEAGDDYVTFEHGLDGDVLIRAWGPDGQPVGYQLAVEIDPGVHEVALVPGVAVRLTAEPEPEPDAG